MEKITLNIKETRYYVEEINSIIRRSKKLGAYPADDICELYNKIFVKNEKRCYIYSVVERKYKALREWLIQTEKQLAKHNVV